jgi:hypothetical protein
VKRIALALVALLAGSAAAEITSVLTLPGGTTGQVQYNNGGGRFGGVAGVTTATIAGLPTFEQQVAASTAAIAVSTTSEAAARLAKDLSIGASTGSLQLQLTSEESSVAASTAAVSVSTTANGVAISTTGAAVSDLYMVKLSTGVKVPTVLLDLSTTAKTGACAGVNFVQGNTNTGPTCAQPSDVTGNAATVTNGVYTNGSYFDPAWIKSLATSKVDGSTYTTRINDLYTVKLSTGVGIPPVLVDLSTVTTRINDLYSVKLSTGVKVPSVQVDLSTVTTAFATKASSGTNADVTALDALGTSKSTPTFTGSLGLGCGPTGTRRLNLCFSANNNSISYGDEAVTFCDPGNGLCLSFGGLYGKSSLYIQAHNGFGGTKKPLGLNPEGGGVSIGGYSPTSSTSTVEVVGGLSVAGTLEAKALKGDGSAITGLATGGDVFKASTQTFSGANTMLSTTTVGVAGGGVYTSTADYSAALKGGCYLIAASSVSNATGLVFTKISSDTYTYFMTYASTKVTAGAMTMTIGGDETSVYMNTSGGFNSAGSAISNVGAAASCNMAGASADPPTDGSYFAGRIDFQRDDKVSKQVAMSGWYNGQSVLDDSHYIGTTIRCHYKGTSSMTSIAIKAATGKFTGHYELWACTSGLAH